MDSEGVGLSQRSPGRGARGGPADRPLLPLPAGSLGPAAGAPDPQGRKSAGGHENTVIEVVVRVVDGLDHRPAVICLALLHLSSIHCIHGFSHARMHRAMQLRQGTEWPAAPTSSRRRCRHRCRCGMIKDAVHAHHVTDFFKFNAANAPVYEQPLSAARPYKKQALQRMPVCNLCRRLPHHGVPASSFLLLYKHYPSQALQRRAQRGKGELQLVQARLVPLPPQARRRGRGRGGGKPRSLQQPLTAPESIGSV